MTYSRQQRDRAVDLYIRYECCAADAIHELGYPSKEALRMWYRERLEEERTGVPSRRGERQRRYSEEQKRGGGPLPRVRQTAQPHHADARLSEKQGTAHGVDRRAGARPAQAETRAGARGVEAEGGGGGRVRKVEIA